MAERPVVVKACGNPVNARRSLRPVVDCIENVSERPKHLAVHLLDGHW